MKNIFLFIFSIFALCSCDNGDLAPQSVEGKTITISFEGAEYRNNDGDTSINIESVKWEKDIRPTSTNESYTFDANNKSFHTEIINEIQYKVTANYIKLSDKSAKIEVEYANKGDGEYCIFTLHFTTATSGTVIWKFYDGDFEEEGRNATFIVE